jgi:hypothetical protein
MTSSVGGTGERRGVEMRVFRLIYTLLAVPIEPIRRASHMNPWKSDVDKVLHGNKRPEFLPNPPERNGEAVKEETSGMEFFQAKN